MSLSIMALLASLAAPSFSKTINNNRLTTQVNDFISAMNRARSEAVQRGTTVAVTRVGDAWSNGWDIVIGGAVNRNFPALTAGNVLSGGLATYQYSATGIFSTLGAQTMYLCHASGETGRQIDISTVGFAHVSTTIYVCP